MNIKHKILIGSSIVAVALATIGFTFVQGAMMNGSEGNTSSDSSKPSSMMMMHPPKPMILVVNSNGHGLMRGVVQSLTINSLIVAGWGGSWTVNVRTNAKLVPSTLSDIKVGDFVGVTGMVSEDNLTITADRVRDWSTNGMMK